MKNSAKKVIDIELLESVIGDDHEFAKELFEIFTENAQRNILKMEEAIKKADNTSWYTVSHAFKGAAKSIGAHGLSNFLEYAQNHPEDNIEKKLEILQKIRNEFELVLNFINKELL